MRAYVGGYFSARTRAEKAATRLCVHACGHCERFIFSGLSNRRGRYVHALAAINDLISVSFHLQDYGEQQRARAVSQPGVVEGEREKGGERAPCRRRFSPR